MNTQQTALMKSIQRKKDRIEQLDDEHVTPSELVEITVLEEQIAEDEKLLAVEWEQIINAHRAGQGTLMKDNGWKYKAKRYFEENYGSEN